MPLPVCQGAWGGKSQLPTAGEALASCHDLQDNLKLKKEAKMVNGQTRMTDVHYSSAYHQLLPFSILSNLVRASVGVNLNPFGYHFSPF